MPGPNCALSDKVGNGDIATFGKEFAKARNIHGLVFGSKRILEALQLRDPHM
jgi:hypothetical protein